MSKKNKIIIFSSIAAIIVTLGVLAVIFHDGMSLYYSLKKQDYQNVDRILANSDISDKDVLKLISGNDITIDEQMAQIIAKNCIGDKKRYKTLSLISAKKGDSLLVNGVHALFLCLSTENIDWLSATILLSNLNNANIKDQKGINLLKKSLNVAEGYKQDEVKEYFDLLLTKDIIQLLDEDTIQSLLMNAAISDEQCLIVIKKDAFPLNNEMVGLIAQNCIKSATRNNILEYISKKLAGDVNIDGYNAIFKCLEAEKPNWAAATILLKDLKDANIMDNNNMCLLSRAIIAANSSEDMNINKYFDILFKKDVDFRLKDAEGNSPMHYTFKYGNKSIIEKIIAFINDWSSGGEDYVNPEFCCLYNANNNGQLPWELSIADINTATDCLLYGGWIQTAIAAAEWGVNNGKISSETISRISNECVEISASYEREKSYSEAIEFCKSAINLIDYAYSNTSDITVKEELDNKRNSIMVKYDNLIVIDERINTPKDSNGKELFLGATIGLDRGVTYIGLIKEFNSDKSKAKVSFYGKTDSIGRIISYTNEEKNNIFSQSLFGVPTDGWYSVRDLILLN